MHERQEEKLSSDLCVYGSDRNEHVIRLLWGPEGKKVTFEDPKKPQKTGCALRSSARAPLGSARLGLARPGSARLGSTRLGSSRPGSARLGSARLGFAMGPARCQKGLKMASSRAVHNSL